MAVQPGDYASVYQFLKSTNEKNLQRMLIDKQFTETHLRLLLRITRSTTEEQFIGHAEKGDFPRIRTSPQEMAIKENFWEICVRTWIQAGLATSSKAS